MPNPPFSSIPQMTFKPLTVSDNLIELVEKSQFNFDQILLNGGGRKGDKGDRGEKGLPGATGQGVQGGDGRRGSFIFFTSAAITSGQLVTDPDILEEDVLIDNDGDYFQAEINALTGDLEWIFKFNISTASLSSYWVDQDLYYALGNPIDEWVRLNEGGFNQNLFAAKRFDKGGGFDRSDFYRLVVGMDTYPYGIPEVSMSICNVLPNNIDPATANPFYQMAFKYRGDAFSNPGANSIFFKYVEEPLTFNRYLFTIDNASVTTYWNHDTNDTDNSFYGIRARNIKFIGKSTGVDTINEFFNITIDQDLTRFTPQKDLHIIPDGIASAELVEGFETIVFNPTTGSDITTFKFGKFIFDNNAVAPNIIELVQDFQLIQSGSLVDLDIFNIELGVSGTQTTIAIEDDVLVVEGTSGTEWRFETDVHIDQRFGLGESSTQVDISALGNIDITNIDSSIVFVTWTNGTDIITSITGGKPNQVLILKPTLSAAIGVSDVREGFFIDDGINIKLGEGGSYAKTFIGINESVAIYTSDGINWYQFGNPKNQRGVKVITPDSDLYGDFDNLDGVQGYFNQRNLVLWSNGSPTYQDVDGTRRNQFITETIINENGFASTLQIQYYMPFEGVA